MCLDSNAIEDLHAVTSAIRITQEARDIWLERNKSLLTEGERAQLDLTKSEAERIFADRIAAHEARLKDLGWTRTIRVESPSATGDTK